MIMYKCVSCGACYEAIGQCDCHADTSYTKVVVLDESEMLIVEHGLREARAALYHTEKWSEDYCPWVVCSNALDVLMGHKKN